VTLAEHGVNFDVPLRNGQKTGWYLDQRENRVRPRSLFKGKGELDVFSYIGAWGIEAAVMGAKGVVCVDDSRPVLESALDNAVLNGVADRIEICHGDAFKVLQGLHASGERFDVVILDPPTFIKRKKDIKASFQRPIGA